MKVMHLSDLHIGKSVNGFSMLKEQRHVFAQIISYIDIQKPDVVLIAGDVYDRAVPSVEAVSLFDDFITELASKEVTVIVISGNHDSPERLSYAGRLLSAYKLHFCGTFDGTLHNVTLSDSYGDVVFWILPFIKPSGVRAFFEDKEIENYTDAVKAALESADVDSSQRNVLLSHQFYTTTGVTPIHSESEINPVGGLDAVDATLLTKFDYVALGHLHGAQNVTDNIRYAGSPIKYSFSERKQIKSVTIVEIKEKGNMAASQLPLLPLHDMRQIRGSLECLIGDDISAFGNKEDYLRVILTDEDEIIDPMGKIRSVYPNVMALDFEKSHTSISVAANSDEENIIEKMSAYDLFSEFFLEMSGGVMSEEQAQIVRELLEKEGEE